jgi:hypothetical protein
MFEDLTCSRYRFSELRHQAPYMFVRPQILMSRNVFDCEILCYESAVILQMALPSSSRDDRVELSPSYWNSTN